MITSNYRNKQAGSLATFIIIGIVLVSLTAGGIYLAKQRGLIAGGVTEGNSELANNPKEQDEAQQDPEGSEDRTQEGAEPNRAPQPTTGEDDDAVAPAAPTQPGSPQSPAQPSPQSGEAPRTGGQVAQIPATGFEDQIMVTTLGVTALMYGSVQYIQSRRRLNRL